MHKNLINGLVDCYRKVLDSYDFKNPIDYHSVSLSRVRPGSLQGSDLIKADDNSQTLSLSPDNTMLNKIFNYCMSIQEAGTGKKALFRTIYTFPAVADDLNRFIDYDYDNNDELNVPINLTPKQVEDFFYFLCDKALQAKELNNNIYNLRQTRFIFTGDVGSGKTTFFNYIFSMYYDKLDELEIIWVRLDLTKDAYSNQEVKDALIAHTSYIIKRFYKEKIGGDFATEALKSISVLYGEDVAKSAITSFLSDNSRPQNSSSELHKNLQLKLVKYISRKYAFIYVFDALDNLRTDSDFVDKIKQFKEIFYDEGIKCVMIAAMRNLSHFLFLKSLSANEIIQESDMRGQPRVYKILPPNLKGVIENRLNYLTDCFEWLFYAHNRSKEKIAKIRNLRNVSRVSTFFWVDDENINYYYKVFMYYVRRGCLFDRKKYYHRNDVTIDSAYLALEKLVGTNFRLLLKSLNQLHKCFLDVLQQLNISPEEVVEILKNQDSEETDSRRLSAEKLNEILSKHHAVIKTLLASNGIYKHPFFYDEIDGELQACPQQSFKHPYIKSLFHGANTTHRCQIYHLLAKIRLLQYSKKFIFEHDTKPLEYLSTHFGYNAAQLKFDLNELLVYNMIKASPVEEDLKRVLKYKFHISVIGENALSQLIGELSYTRIVLNDILIPSVYADKLTPLFEYTENTKFTNRSRLLGSVVVFLLMVKSIECQENEFYELQKSEIPFSEWEIFPVLRDKFLSVFRSMLADKKNVSCNFYKRVVDKIDKLNLFQESVSDKSVSSLFDDVFIQLQSLK
ncbi:hypothetical protein G3N56_05525 [Desulfovibrio sulfodismutans]|uniref:Uncharacterized protein n=1 Tax=Desulfolutivibrio sulfodismutans TaxID=63561 RepID=A0A7K3NJ26_9BACT|nr:hypothetical protein [Desulfolutivibrio sulfodismutans]NDY56206.1 hypothetical protein [Desulfolutivibrio sulfodismutans]QLA12362.1 hypothetical protein GD606_08790 [Desulfolutivibrio sulfodismutans DSM 3696]